MSGSLTSIVFSNCHRMKNAQITEIPQNATATARMVGNTAVVCNWQHTCTSVGEWMHVLPSHTPLGELQGFRRGTKPPPQKTQTSNGTSCPVHITIKTIKYLCWCHLYVFPLQINLTQADSNTKKELYTTGRQSHA